MGAARVPLSQKDVEAMMGASSRQKPPNDRRADAREQIGARYAAHALAIADALGNKPLCVITGPHRFGKTASLLPALANILRARGKSASIVNSRDYEEESFTLESLPPGRFDVLIMDEVNTLMTTKEKTRELLQLLHKRATAVVPIITHYAGYESTALYYARFWQEAESSIISMLYRLRSTRGWNDLSASSSPRVHRAGPADVTFVTALDSLHL